MVVPQAMSYANIAGLPSVYGLYGAFLPVIAYALIGSSRHLAVGPVAVTSLLISSSLKRIVDGSADISNPNNPLPAQVRRPMRVGHCMGTPVHMRHACARLTVSRSAQLHPCACVGMQARSSSLQGTRLSHTCHGAAVQLDLGAYSMLCKSGARPGCHLHACASFGLPYDTRACVRAARAVLQPQHLPCCNRNTHPPQESIQESYNRHAIQLSFLVACLYTAVGVLRLGFLTSFLSHRWVGRSVGGCEQRRGGAGRGSGHVRASSLHLCERLPGWPVLVVRLVYMIYHILYITYEL